MNLELVLVGGFALLGAGLLAWRGTRTMGALALAVVAASAAGALLFPPEIDTALRSALPDKKPHSGTSEYADYVSSDACQTCHPGAYDAWEKSFHRKMTQPATPETVVADFNNVTLESRGHRIHLERRGEEFWAELPDPLWFQDRSPNKVETPPRIEARIVMTTGSHHLQNYWIRRPQKGAVYRESHDNGALIQIPFVWLIDATRWVPGQDSFLTPYSDQPESLLVWNTSCHVCHSVATAPGFADDQFKTESVELGIACEACHGPGEAHVALHQNPVRRYQAHLGIGNGDSKERDPLIQNAARMDRDRSVETCGQCHSFSRIVDQPKWRKTGLGYRPGEPLENSKALLRFSENPTDPQLLAQLAVEPNALVGRFWNDGTIRVTGREMNAVVESACFERGELTCLSCHSMHDYAAPDDQLAKRASEDAACLDCHANFATDVAAHTQHAPDSDGSLCMNCHMPHTTYGLFSAIRSHRIDSPSVATTVETGRPNACNLCHLDKSLEWADRALQEGWGASPARLPPRDREIAASVEWALAGDAAQRAVVAWHLGWGPAREASGSGWQPLYLGQLLADPYAAVRRVAQLSLEKQAGFETFDYDYLLEGGDRAAKSQEAWGRWRKHTNGSSFEGMSPLLLKANGELETKPYELLLRARDNTPLRIIE